MLFFFSSSQYFSFFCWLISWTLITEVVPVQSVIKYGYEVETLSGTKGLKPCGPGSVQTLNSVGLNIITANTLMSFHIYTKCFHTYSNSSMQREATIRSIAMHSCTTNMSQLNYGNISAEQGLSRQMERQTEVELGDLMRGFIAGFQDLFGRFEQWRRHPVLRRVDKAPNGSVTQRHKCNSSVFAPKLK